MAEVAPVVALGVMIEELLAITGEMSASIAATDAAVAAAGETTAIATGAGLAEGGVASMTVAAEGTVAEGLASSTFAASETLGIAAPEAALEESASMAASLEAASTSSMAAGETSMAAAESLGQVVTSTPFAEGGFESIELSSIEPVELSFSNESALELFETVGSTVGNATISAPTILGASMIAGAGATAGVTAASFLAGGTSVAAASGGILGATTATAAGALTAKIVTAIGSGIALTAGPIIYKIVTSLDSYLPGASEFITNAINSGSIDIDQKDVASFISMLMSNTMLLAKLKAAGINLTMLPNGQIVKVGEAIYHALKYKNIPESLWHNSNEMIAGVEIPTMVRNLNSDIIKEIWQATTQI